MPIGSCGYQWIAICTYGGPWMQWMAIGACGSLWIDIGVYRGL